MQIGDNAIGIDEPTFVIAEAGSNHNGDIEMAKELIEVAADAGVDAVKFQTFRAEDMYVEDSGEADYLDDSRTIYEIIESMEMPLEWIPQLYEYCRDCNVYFMSTPFDPKSADALGEYVPAYKIASYTMSHHPFLEYIAEKELPVLMSTGAHELAEVAESVEVLRNAGLDDIGLFQCVSAYPTPLESINIRVIQTLSSEFGLPAGLSDHTLDPIVAPGTAVALGADLIEKHFTLDRTLDGPDHQFALEPPELEEMVSHIRSVETALGSHEKSVLPIEEELHDVARRRIHASKDIPACTELTEENVAVLRSGKQENGLHPKFYNDVLGSLTKKPINQDRGITWEDIKQP